MVNCAGVRTGAGPHPGGLLEREQRRTHQALRRDSAAKESLPTVAVDGKSARGARRIEDSRVHLLAAARHADGLGL